MEKKLKPEQRLKIYNAIHKAMLPDDKLPEQVIRDSFCGNEEAYLRTMAEYHKVKLD